MHLRQVARLIPTPVVYPSTNIVYITATPYLMINGTNFNTKNTQLYFSPPLSLGDDIRIAVSHGILLLLVCMCLLHFKKRAIVLERTWEFSA